METPNYLNAGELLNRLWSINPLNYFESIKMIYLKNI